MKYLSYEKWLKANEESMKENYQFDIDEITRNPEEGSLYSISTFEDYLSNSYRQYLEDLIEEVK